MRDPAFQLFASEHSVYLQWRRDLGQAYLPKKQPVGNSLSSQLEQNRSRTCGTFMYLDLPPCLVHLSSFILFIHTRLGVHL